MSQIIQPQPGILNIKPYVGGEDIIPKGYAAKALLSSNENPLGPSPRAIHAAQEQAARMHIYPSGSAKKLKSAIAGFHGIDENRILCTNGSEDGLTLLIRAFAGPGDEVIYPRYAFSLYGIATQAVGAKPVVAETCDYNIDVDAILDCVSPQTTIVVIDNPRNPIGSYLNAEEVRRLRQQLPPHVLLILDSAYAEYQRSADYTSGADLVDEYENVVMTRTFSKFYGLAGLRLGWMYGSSDIINYVNRIRAPFCCNSLVQAAGIAALEDKEHQASVLVHQQTTLPWFMEQLTALGYTYVPSVTNFVLVEFPATGPHTAHSAYLRMAQEGYIVRPIENYGLPNHLRITLGSRENMEAVVDILSSFLDDSSGGYGIKQQLSNRG